MVNPSTILVMIAGNGIVQELEMEICLIIMYYALLKTKIILYGSEPPGASGLFNVPRKFLQHRDVKPYYPLCSKIILQVIFFAMKRYNALQLMVPTANG